jgi:hypothetical protein
VPVHVSAIAERSDFGLFSLYDQPVKSSRALKGLFALSAGALLASPPDLLAWANGGEAPVKVLAGAATGLNNPRGIAVEPSGATFAVNYNASPQSMSAYAGDWQNGDTAPSKTLAGISTGLADPQDVAIDSSGRTYTANLNGDVTVHAADWAAGNTAPIRSIPTRGANTGLIDPQGIDATDDGTIYVTQTLRDGSFPPTRFGQVRVFSPTASGDVAPIRTISGSNAPGNTGMGYATGVAVGPDGLIYVAADWDGVKVFSASADGDVAPVKALSGSASRVAFDASGRLYVADHNASEIRTYEAGFADGASPIKTLTGGSSGLSRLTDLAFDSSGRMYVAIESPSSVRVFSTSYQTISFPAIADTTLAASRVTPSASASSSEAVTFTTTTPGVCTSGGANGASISLVGTGTCTVRASQGGNATWNPATPVDRSFVITDAPGAPTSASAIAGDAQATLSWSAPSSDGGSAITSYTAIASPGGATCTTSSTSCTITGLANGTSYTFTVTATNSAGTSAASSASASVTPATANEATSSPSLTVRLLPSRRSLRAGQAMRLGVRTSNSPSTGTAMARMGGQMASATAEEVRTCVRLPANLVVTGRPAGSLRSGRTVCWDSTGIPAGQQRTKVLRVRAIAVRGGSHAISASARTTAGTQASARATAKTRVRISPRAPRLPVTG